MPIHPIAASAPRKVRLNGLCSPAPSRHSAKRTPQCAPPIKAPFMHTNFRSLLAAAIPLRVAVAAAVACMPTLSPALNLLIDTNTGKLAVCPDLNCAITANAVSFNGASIAVAGVSNGLRQFIVSGNFVMNEGNRLTVGDQSNLYGAKFFVSNNAVLRGTIDVSARGAVGVAGGGMGGAAGLPVAPTGVNTIPTPAGQGGSGGAQGATNKAEFYWILEDWVNVNAGGDGNKGAGGVNSNGGARGAIGTRGGDGSSGTRGMLNQQAFVGMGGSGGLGGAAGIGGLPGRGGVRGGGGTGFFLESNWSTSPYGSLPNNGGRGDAGANGQRGSNGANANWGNGAGAPERGTGATVRDQDVRIFAGNGGGGAGGWGGQGGAGSAGGRGGSGGVGTSGGGGGGLIEIEARGMMVVGGSLRAAGGLGVRFDGLVPPEDGSAALPGGAGGSGQSPGSTRGVGGAAGSGGTGGAGGNGGLPGFGGGGGGGSIRLTASELINERLDIQVAGGLQTAAGGSFYYGGNTTATLTRTDGSAIQNRVVRNATGQSLGAVEGNRFVDKPVRGGDIRTPYLFDKMATLADGSTVGIQGDAALYGLLGAQGPAASIAVASFVDGLRAQAPAGSAAIIMRMLRLGFAGATATDFENNDLILIINIGSHAVVDPKMVVQQTDEQGNFPQSVTRRELRTGSTFPGIGEQMLRTLDPGAIWLTSFSDDGPAEFAFSASGMQDFKQALAPGQWAAITAVPEPASWVLMAGGIAALLWRRRQGRGTTDARTRP